MTRKLEDLFNLPDNEDMVKNTEEVNPLEQMQNIIKQNTNKKENFEATSDIELDDIATAAKNTYNDLMTLGMNVDSRYSARIFEVASAFLKISLDAKSTKVNKVLKTMELEYKKSKDEGKQSSANFVGADHIVSDRNSLLDKIRNLN